MSEIAPAEGNYTFSFTVSNPNGGMDENVTNDTATSDFFMNTTGSGVTISVGGGWDSEIGWSLDLNGTVLASGGAFCDGMHPHWVFHFQHDRQLWRRLERWDIHVD